MVFVNQFYYYMNYGKLNSLRPDPYYWKYIVTLIIIKGEDETNNENMIN